MFSVNKKSWNDVSISEWKALCEINERDCEDMEKNVSTLALLAGVSENDVWNTPVFELKSLFSQIGWMDEFSFNRKAKFNKLVIGDETYEVTADLNKMTIAAYVDFQIYLKDRENNMGNILTCFIVPKGKNYGEGYDTAELAKKFEDTLSIVFWNDIFFFFLKNCLYSIRATRIYLERLTKIMGKNPEAERKVKELMELMDSYGLA